MFVIIVLTELNSKISKERKKLNDIKAVMGLLELKINQDIVIIIIGKIIIKRKKMVEIKNKIIEKIEKEREFEDLNTLEKRFDSRFKTAKQKVLKILKEDKEARRNYFYLCLKVWILSNNIKLIIPLEKYGEMVKPETICRIRRQLIHEAKKGNKKLKFLLEDKENLKENKEMAEESRIIYGYKRAKEWAGNIEGDLK